MSDPTNLKLIIQPPPVLRATVTPPAEFKTTLQVGQGPAGPSGAGVLPPFQFLTPMSVWVINHNLNRRPLVGVFTIGGMEMLAEVIHISANQVQVSFDDPVAGYAVCS